MAIKRLEGGPTPLLHSLPAIDNSPSRQLFYSSFSNDIFLAVSRRNEFMANHKSAEKRVRQTEKRNEVNSRNRGRLRTEIRKLRAAIAAGDPEKAKALLVQTVSLIDKSIQKGIIHRNAAARYK